MFAKNESDRRFGENMPALDTKSVRALTDAEAAQCRRHWDTERSRLQPEIDRKKREWFSNRGKDLAKSMPDASPEQIRGILDHRRSGDIVGSDVIELEGEKVTISEILLNPDKYDGMIGPDPIEPDYQNGAKTCKVFMNRSNGRPMIYSQAHGGVNYRLWYDTPSVLGCLRAMDTAKAQAALKTVLHATRPNDSAEAEWLLRELAKLLKTTKKALIKVYRAVLRRNMRAVSPITEYLDHTKTNDTAQINDISHNAAKRFISTQIAVQCDESQVWIYNGKCWETASDRYLAQTLMKILTEQGWEKESGLTRITRDAITSLKEQTHTKTPIIARKPKRILNFQNGELHLLSTGKVEFKEHDPSSGLTYVLPFDYDPNVEAPIFQQTLEEIFWAPAYERMKKRSKAAQARYEKKHRGNAKIMRKHVEEVLAYLLIPDRWIPVWFLWIGDGGNGKTFLTKIINLLLDDSTVESDRLQSITKDSFGLARLIGKTLFIDDDLDINTTIPDGFVKTFSETKSLSANRKFQKPLRFENRCAVLLLTNNYPRMIDVSGGTTRRFHSIVFPRRFYSRQEIQAMVDGPQKDFAEFDQAEPRLIDQIRAELPGMANVLIRAYRRLIKRDGFRLPDAVKKSNDKLLRHSNPLPMFIDSQCNKDVESRVKTSEYARALRLWIDDQFIKWRPSNLQIRTMMRHSGYQVKTINGYEHYVGIALKSENALTADSHTDRDDDWHEDDLDDWDDWDDCDANNVARIH